MTKWRVLTRLFLALASFTFTMIILHQAFFAERVPPGYFLGDVHLVGMSRTDFKKLLTEKFSSNLLIELSTGTSRAEASVKDLGITYDLDRLTNEVIGSPLVLSRVLADWQRLKRPVILTAAFDVDQTTFDQKLTELATNLSAGATDASVGFNEEEEKYQLVPAKPGLEVSRTEVAIRLREALSYGNQLIPTRAAIIAPDLSDEKVQPAVDEANTWLNQQLTVNLLGEKRTLSKSVIKSGIVFLEEATDDNLTFKASLTEEEMADSIKEFTKGINQTERVIDQTRLAKQITEAIKSGTTSITAASYVPHPVSPPVTAQAPTATTSSSSASVASSGNYLRATGSHGAGGPGGARIYSVLVEDSLGIDANAFASEVEMILDDERSWRASGKLHFARVETGGFELLLVTPKTVDRLCYPLNTNGFTSCRASNRVVINSDRWLGSSPYFVGSLTEYRQYLINHEVGHMIGQPHHPCPGSGIAPVMHQQTLGMKGCTTGPWPLDWELGRL